MRVPENHTLQIPVHEFGVGEDVEVLVVHKPQESPASQALPTAETLLGTVLRYDEPFEPLNPEDWEAVR